MNAEQNVQKTRKPTRKEWVKWALANDAKHEEPPVISWAVQFPEVLAACIDAMEDSEDSYVFDPRKSR